VQYTEEQLAGFRTAYKERWRRTYWPSAFVSLLLLLSLFISLPDRWMGTLWLVGIVGMNALNLIIYRCPACGGYFGFRLRIYLVCPNCGVQLVDETRQSPSMPFAPLTRLAIRGDADSQPLSAVARFLSMARSYFVTAVLLIVLVLGLGYILGVLPHDELGWHSVGQTSPFIYLGAAGFCCGLFLIARYGERLAAIEYVEAHDQWLADMSRRGAPLSWALQRPGWIPKNTEASRLLTGLRVGAVFTCLPVLWLLLWLFVNAR
jgi:hypothetical protein